MTEEEDASIAKEETKNVFRLKLLGLQTVRSSRFLLKPQRAGRISHLSPASQMS
jgi:hypothetical protein